MNRVWLVLPAFLGSVVCDPVAAQDPEPAAPVATKQLDRTGVRWVLPFEKAMERAKEERRLLVVPVIAGGTRPSGCW